MVSLIQEKIGYKIVGSEWGRLGAIIKKYGKDSVVRSIDDMAKWSFKPTPFINILEKQCQKNVQTNHGDIDKEIGNIL